MAMQTIPGGLWIPRPMSGIAAPNIVDQTINASGNRFQCLFNVPKTGTISKIGILCTVATAPATTDARIETVDTSTGLASTALAASGANGSFTPAAGWNTITLGTPLAVTAGALLAVVMQAGGASTSLRFGMMDQGQEDRQFPYGVTISTRKSGYGMYALEYNDGTYAFLPHVIPASALNTNTFNNGSTPDERALKFQIPFPARATGCWAYVDADGDFDILLIDSDGTTALTTVAVDKDVRFSATAGPMMFRFATNATLAAATDYYLSVRPSSATNMTLYSWSYPSTAVMNATEGGANFRSATRTNAGAWSVTTTEQPLVGLLFDQFDDGISGAGEQCYASAG